MPRVTLIRAGVWKPRTRPGGFEGLGEPALQWMQELSKEYGVHYCCEVARPEHVELCQRYGVTTVWIGARTTGNPFMVEELCSALAGSGMTVLVKNPTSPDVSLWLGAIERVEQAGVAVVSAVHRGFAMYHNHGYRNEPLWEVPMTLRREMPEIPLLCDPSHIGGRRELVAQLARTAEQFDYDGLMVEVHPSPDTALTDAPQQLAIEAFADLLLQSSTFKHQQSNHNSPLLDPLRHQIDEIDHELLSLLARRMEMSRQISFVKRDLQIPAYQAGRWADVVADRMEQAASLGLDADFTRALLEKIHGESIRVQLADKA
jgi:chorismate mutase